MPLLLAAAVSLLLAALAAAQPQEVSFQGATNLALNATLLTPDSPGPHPAVLLLPGSGPTDRNGNQPGLKIDLHKQLAEHLAENGVATLRFDKRAVLAYAEHWPKDSAELAEYFSFQNFTADAAAAYRFLRDHPSTDPARVAILGHSEGGLIALQVAADMASSKDRPAGLILAATAGRVLDDVVREQISAALAKQTQDENVRAEYKAHLERGIKAAKAGDPIPKDLPPGLAPLFNPSTARILHAYFTIDPADLAAKVKGPVLVIQGSADAQISAERDAPRLLAALMKRPHSASDSIIIPDASHNFKVPAQDDKSPLAPFTGPVTPAALDHISGWARTHLGAPASARPDESPQQSPKDER